MRLRTLLAATAAGSLLAGGLTGVAQAAAPPSPQTLNAAGTVFAWGNDAAAGPAIAMGEVDSRVVSVATNPTATAAVTADGHFHIWGAPTPLVTGAADLIANTTDAVAVSVSPTGPWGALLHADGKVSAWGLPGPFTADLDDEEFFPGGLKAKAVAVSGSGAGYAVKLDGTLATWGALDAAGAPPGGLSDLVDISAGAFQVMALKSNGTAVAWGVSDDDLASMDMAPGGYNTVPSTGGKKITKIVAENYVNSIILEDGSAKIWGTPNMVPAGAPSFTGKKVVSLSFSTSNGGAVDSDGNVYTWGTNTFINNEEEKEPLTGEPVASISLAANHAVAIITTFRKLSETTATGVARPGQTLTATPATYSLAPTTATGEWFVNGAASGKTDPALALDSTLIGKAVSYHTSATRGDVTLESASTPVTVIDPATTPECKAANAKAASAKTAAGKATTASTKAANQVKKAKKQLKKAKKKGKKGKVKKAKAKVKKAQKANKKAAATAKTAATTATSTATAAAAACK